MPAAAMISKGNTVAVLVLFAMLGVTRAHGQSNSPAVSRVTSSADASGASTPIPGTVTQRTFSFAGATYNYSVFTPSHFTSQQALPAFLLIHGSGGKGRDMINLWQSFADQHAIILVAPTFPLDERFEKDVPQLYPQLMETVRQTWHFDPHRVYVLGYSAGGYSTFDAALLTSYFAAAGVFAGIITRDYEHVVTKAKRKTPIAIYIGDHDQFFSLKQTRRTRDLLEKNGVVVHYVEIPNQDHNYGAAAATVNPDVWKFMSQYTLP